jgi:hypothetical protein
MSLLIGEDPTNTCSELPTVTVARRKGGAKLVRDIDLVPRKSRGRLLDRWLLRPRTA